MGLEVRGYCPRLSRRSGGKMQGLANGLRELDRQEVAVRIQVVLVCLVDNTQQAVSRSHWVGNDLIDLTHLQCSRVAVIPDAHNQGRFIQASL